MSRFLVTGGAGFIGSHLVEALLDDGHGLRVLDDLSTGYLRNLPRQAEFIEADVADTEAVDSAFEGVDGCFHLAAIASVPRSHCDWVRSHQVNLTGTINVFDQAKPSRRKREVPVVYASTAAIYGNYGSVPVDEECPAAPLSAYGADKYACELHARIAGAIHGVPTVGLRFFNLYGPRQASLSPYSGVVSIFAERLLSGEPVEIFGNGEQTRDFTLSAMPSARCVERCGRQQPPPLSSTYVPGRGRASSASRRPWPLCAGRNSWFIAARRDAARCGCRSAIRAARPSSSGLLRAPRLPTVWR